MCQVLLPCAPFIPRPQDSAQNTGHCSDALVGAVAAGTKGKDLDVRIKKGSLYVGIKGKPANVDGARCHNRPASRAVHAAIVYYPCA